MLKMYITAARKATETVQNLILRPKLTKTSINKTQDLPINIDKFDIILDS